MMATMRHANLNVAQCRRILTDPDHFGFPDRPENQ